MSRMTKQEKSWVFYDWANSAYSILITTAIFPLYFKAAADGAGLAGSTSTAYLGYANSFGTLLVSICAPILGTIGDFKGLKKEIIHLFLCILGIAFTACLLLSLVINGLFS